MKLLKKAAFYLLALLLFVYLLFPFYWAVVTSLRPAATLFQLRLLPEALVADHYRQVFLEQPFLRNFLNSVCIAGATVTLTLGVSVLAAFALGKREFRGKRGLLLAFLMVSMFPQIAVLSGLFQLIRILGLFNTWPGLILSYLILSVPFTTWTLHVFVRQVPRGIEEAAIMDGAPLLSIIFRIFVPILKPSIAATSMLSFIAAWNEFLFALTFTLTDQARTIPVVIAMMSGASQYETPWGAIMAASVVATLPVVAVVVFFQKRIVSGLTAGAVRG